MDKIRIALGQINLTVGDLEANSLAICDAIFRAKAWRVDLVVLPELAITGYPPEDLLLKQKFIEDNMLWLGRVQRATEGISAFVGFVDTQKKSIYNSAAVLSDGKRLAVYHKQNLPNYGVFDERRYFSAGKEPLILKAGGARIGITICEDLWQDQPLEVLARKGCVLAVNLSASPYHTGKSAQRRQVFKSQARKNHLAIAYCNLVGGQDELVFDGASLIIDSKGQELACGFQFKEDLVIADIPIDDVFKPAKDSKVISLFSSRSEKPPVFPARRARLGRVEEIYEALVLGTRDYVEKNGFKSVVLGLSGGVDSSLTACIAVDALGKERVAGVVMPSRFSSKETQSDARKLAQNLGIRLEEVSIEPCFSAYLQVLDGVFSGRKTDVTEQNLQARIRGTLLMALSNKFGWLVLTTGNKSEMATGYCTLYGDMAGGFAVIKDVPKTIVYELARNCNKKSGRALIPESVFVRVPTAELAPNQTDQDTLPPYDELDSIVKAYVENDLSLADMLSSGSFKAQTLKRVIRMIDSSEYKRRQGPPGIKITPKAFGKDRRMPITNRYQQS